MSIIKDTFFGGAQKKAGEAQSQADLAGVAEQRRQFDLTQESFEPFRQAGLTALDQQKALLGLSGEQAGVDAMAKFNETPGQKFLRERQEKSLLRNQSAIGGLGGGNIRTALQEQAAGIAATQLGDYQNKLASLTGAGQTATSNVANVGSSTASNIQQGLANSGDARASGILGRASGIQQGITGAAQLFAGGGFSDIALKENIKLTGKLPSGLNWYSWDWKEEAKSLVGNQPSYGVIAQEAKEMFHDAVNMVSGYLHVDYRRIG